MAKNCECKINADQRFICSEIQCEISDIVMTESGLIQRKDKKCICSLFRGQNADKELQMLPRISWNHRLLAMALLFFMSVRREYKRYISGKLAENDQVVFRLDYFTFPCLVACHCFCSLVRIAFMISTYRAAAPVLLAVYCFILRAVQASSHLSYGVWYCTGKLG